MPRKPSVYATPEWRRARLEYIKDKPRQCEVCNYAIPKKSKAPVHHIYGVGSDPGHKHLLWLCHSCHDLLETMFKRKRNPYTTRIMSALLRLVADKRRGCQTKGCKCR